MKSTTFFKLVILWQEKLDRKIQDMLPIDRDSARLLKSLHITINRALLGSSAKFEFAPTPFYDSGRLAQYLDSRFACSPKKVKTLPPYKQGEEVLTLVKELQDLCDSTRAQDQKLHPEWSKPEVSLSVLRYLSTKKGKLEKRERSCRMLIASLLTAFQQGSNGLFFRGDLDFLFREAEARVRSKTDMVIDI